jgi:hypothetical protein
MNETRIPMELDIVRSNPTPSRPGDTGSRQLFCDRYSHCLTLAVKKRWRSFSCARCPAYALTDVDALFAPDLSPESPHKSFKWIPK